MASPWDLATKDAKASTQSRPRAPSNVETTLKVDGTVKFSLGAPTSPQSKLFITESTNQNSFAGEWVGVAQTTTDHVKTTGSQSVSRRQRSLSWECNYLNTSTKRMVETTQVTSPSFNKTVLKQKNNKSVVINAATEADTNVNNANSYCNDGDNMDAIPHRKKQKQNQKRRSALKSIFSRALSIEDSPPPSQARDSISKSNSHPKKQSSHASFDKHKNEGDNGSFPSIDFIASNFQSSPAALKRTKGAKNEDEVSASIRAWSTKQAPLGSHKDKKKKTKKKKTKDTAHKTAKTIIVRDESENNKGCDNDISRPTQKSTHSMDTNQVSHTAAAAVSSVPKTAIEALTALEKKARKKAKRAQKVVRRALLMFRAVAMCVDPQLGTHLKNQTKQQGSKTEIVKKKKKCKINNRMNGVESACILSIDIEAYERNHDRILEIGCTRYTYDIVKVRSYILQN